MPAVWLLAAAAAFSGGPALRPAPRGNAPVLREFFASSWLQRSVPAASGPAAPPAGGTLPAAGRGAPWAAVVLAAVVYSLPSAARLRASPAPRMSAQRMSAPRMSAVAEGDVATVEYSLRPDMDSRAKDFGDTMIDGVNFDIGKVSFVVGGGGYFDGLHETVVGMKAGEKKDVSIDAGYGDYQEEGIIKAPIEQAPDGLKPGMTVQLQANQGIVQATVTAVDAETVTLDMNPPLAGCKYLLDVTVEKVEPASQFETATFAGGCFWGLELAYQREPGVVFTAVGYTQGDKEEPTYQEVCSGTTGHTEAVQVLFDPREVSYKRLCELLVERLENNLYLLNQVGNDRGTQYRHGIYPHTPEQEATAKEVLEAVGDHPSLGPVQTEVKSAGKFWTAEDYHLQYLQKGGQSAKKKAEETIRCYG